MLHYHGQCAVKIKLDNNLLGLVHFFALSGVFLFFVRRVPPQPDSEPIDQLYSRNQAEPHSEPHESTQLCQVVNRGHSKHSFELEHILSLKVKVYDGNVLIEGVVSRTFTVGCLKQQR